LTPDILSSWLVQSARWLQRVSVLFGSPRKMESPGQGWDLYRRVLGSPKYVVAPMVEQSELAWRILSRRYGAQLIYTPMINSKLYAECRKNFRETHFNLKEGEEGGPGDRPLIVQFHANDPNFLLQAALMVQDHCDAVDINFGCPQDIARRGKYGAFLQDNWDLVYQLINILHENLKIPVTAKFRVFSTIEKTVEYAKMMERAGAQILTCHGRTREQRGTLSGLADWEKIRAVKQAVSVPVFANGNVLFHEDIDACLEATGCDAVMSAEGNLYNPAIFAGTYPKHADLALEYLEIVKSLKTATPLVAAKGHLFKLMRPALMKETDLRNRLGATRGGIPEYEQIVLEMKARMDEQSAPFADQDVEGLATIHEPSGLKLMPHWVAQPYFRPLPGDSRSNRSPQAAALQTTGIAELVSTLSPLALGVVAS